MAAVDWHAHRVRERVRALELASRSSELFGAPGHGFRLFDPADEVDLVGIESAYGFRLPDGHRSFVLQVGNGGAGPGYGLFPFFRFGDTAAETEPWADHITDDPGAPFPLDAAWNLPEDQLSPPDGLGEEEEDARFEELEELTFRDLLAGTIPISHEGCAYWIRLVVTGPVPARSGSTAWRATKASLRSSPGGPRTGT